MTPPLLLPPIDHARRVERVRAAVADAGCDALVVSDLTNARYLCGFTGSAGLLVVRPDDAVLVTDGRYRHQAADQLAAAGVDADVVITRETDDALADLLGGTGRPGRVGLEADHVTWELQRRWRDAIDADLVPTVGLVLGLRAVKDDAEVARLELAAAIADEALAEVRPMLHDQPTEREVARALEAAMVTRGAQGPSFETIVASGPNGAKPHARPTDRRIVDGDLVVIDFGARYDGYHSDMTRTFAVGEPTAVQQRMLDVVASAQAAGVATVRAGVACAAVDAACRDVIGDAGWADAFVHGTGHGIGLVIHEQPRLAHDATGVLAAGHCVTVEPGVYLPDHGGVRIEDSLLVTDGGSRPLTSSPYEPTP